MTVVTSGVVLSRKKHREWDRMVTLYTKDFGKIQARFSGVDRPRGKLKALAEPIVCAEYRLYMRQLGAPAVVTGGSLTHSFPRLRQNFDALMGALEICEALARVAADSSPNPEKYELLVHCLEELDRAPSASIATRFGVKLLELAGLDLHPAPQESDMIHSGRWTQLKWRVEQAIEHQSERPLNTRLTRESMQRFAEATQ